MAGTKELENVHKVLELFTVHLARVILKDKNSRLDLLSGVWCVRRGARPLLNSLISFRIPSPAERLGALLWPLLSCAALCAVHLPNINRQTPRINPGTNTAGAAAAATEYVPPSPGRSALYHAVLLQQMLKYLGPDIEKWWRCNDVWQ